VLPEQASTVRRRAAFVDCAEPMDLRAELRAVLAQRPSLIFVDHADLINTDADRGALASLLDEVTFGSEKRAVVLAVQDHAVLADLIPSTYSYLTLGPVADLTDARTG
jgi:hypothetical protein